MSEQTPGQRGSGPRSTGKWCCACGAWGTEDNGLEECPVSTARMKAMGAEKGLSHIWAYGVFERALTIWHDDANARHRLAECSS